MKDGVGMVRQEIEREVTPEQFDRNWPRTRGRRLSKTRYRLRDGKALWEIDVFDGDDLAVAEVELPSADARFDIPPWLAPVIVRDVTDDPAYTNAAIAARLSAG
jgi:CYTH domain-containing protein